MKKKIPYGLMVYILILSISLRIEAIKTDNLEVRKFQFFRKVEVKEERKNQSIHNTKKLPTYYYPYKKTANYP